MGLPGLSARAIASQLETDITDVERAIASQPGMYGRTCYGHGLAFDEAYQILQHIVCISVHNNSHIV